MKTGTLPGGSQQTSLGGVDAHCGIHHHYESFGLSGPRISSHFNQYYSYSVEDGFFHGRPEFPGNAVGPVGGPGTAWTAYNLFEAPKGSVGDGHWQIELRPDPSDPARVLHEPGWFVWDIVDLNGDGTAELLATRAPGTGYIPPWEVDILTWNGTQLQSVYHRDGVVPSLFAYPRTSARYVIGGSSSMEGAITGDIDGDKVEDVMVEDKEGRRSFLRVPPAAIKK
jgi:hypothetical protein